MPRYEFKAGEVERLLVHCHRRCCVCHRYCGVKIEVDHIESATKPGSGAIENAIALCFDCHAEVHQYNAAHPKGRRFMPSELRAHRDQWLQLCKRNPEMFVQAQPAPEAGSLERLLSELEFNRVLASGGPGVAFETVQFRRAIADGTFVWLPDALATVVRSAYAAMAEAAAVGQGHLAGTRSEMDARAALTRVLLPIGDAITKLSGVLWEDRSDESA